MGDEAARANDRFLNELPFEPRGNPFDALTRAAAVVSGADEDGVGKSVRLVQAGIVDAVEEVLKRTAHVTEILRGPENNGVSPEDVVRNCIKGPLDARFDADNIRVPGTVFN